MKNKKLTHS